MNKPYFELDFPVEMWEPDAAYNVNRELSLAWELIEQTGANLFLTGRAGTGKTTFLRRLRERSAKNMVVLAPTGVAAINAHGNTIHSFFQLPFAPYLPGKGFLTSDKKHLNMSKVKKRLISALSLLVIDEISMVRPDVLDAIDNILRRVRNTSRPFGGVQLLLIGDLRQLPPVVKETEWDLLKQKYNSPYFFDSHALKKTGFNTVELTVVYRQSDALFLDILNNVRDGKVDVVTLTKLNSRFIPGFNPPDEEGYIRLTTHNRNATAINEAHLDALPSIEFTFEAEVTGDFPESAFPADKILRLKEGSQVMFIKNDTGYQRRFYNGLIGTVTSISEEKICVRPLSSDNIIEVERTEWENTRYNVDEKSGNVFQETVGTFLQYPLQLAWAITIHKSQGLTFDRAIIDATRSFAPGQTYVALSRCRTLEGLVLGAPIPPSAVIIDSEVNDFIQYCEANAPDSATVTALQNDYLHLLLGELFDFDPLRRSFNDFYRYVQEYIVPSMPAMEEEMEQCKKMVADELANVGRKFIDSCRGADITGSVADRDSAFSKRIRKGCEYFLERMEDLDDVIAMLPKNLNNKEYAKRLNTTYDIFSYLFGVKKLLLKTFIHKAFGIDAYLHAKAKATVQTDPAVRSFIAQGKRK